MSYHGGMNSGSGEPCKACGAWLHIVSMFISPWCIEAGAGGCGSPLRCADTERGLNVQALGWLLLFFLAVVALWGMASLHASLMVSGRTEQAQERLEQETAAWDAALDEMDATLLPERTIADLAEQVGQMELRLRALEGKVG